MPNHRAGLWAKLGHTGTVVPRDDFSISRSRFSRFRLLSYSFPSLKPCTEQHCSCLHRSLEHLATVLDTCTVLGDLSEHCPEATATSLEVTVQPLGSFCLPLWSLDTGTLTGILTTSPFFSRKSEYPCTVLSRPANNYHLMQRGIMIPDPWSLLWQLGRQNTFPFCL